MTLHRLLVFLLSLSILSLAPPVAAAEGWAAPIGIHAGPVTPEDPSAPVILFEQGMVPPLPQEAAPTGGEPEGTDGEDAPVAGLLPRPGGLAPLSDGLSVNARREATAGGRPWPTGPPRA